MLKVFAARVATQASLTIGTTLFAGWRPDTAPDRCVTLLERVGTLTDLDKPALRQQQIQILTRDTTYFTCHDLAHSVFQAIIGDTGIQLTDFYIHHVSGSAPAFIGQDAKGRFEFSANLVVRYKKE